MGINQKVREEAYIRRPNMTTDEELKIARERFNVIFQNTTVSIWDYYLETKQIVQPTRSQSLHGFDTVVENVPEGLIESGFIHPDSAEAFREMYNKIFAGEERAEGIFRVQTADRTDYWYEHIRYHTLFNEKGEPYVAVGMSTDVTDEIRLKEKAQRDALTGLFNKKTFEERAKSLLARFPEREHVLFNIDLDNFKNINDTYGHETGDEILCIVAKRILDATRKFSSAAIAARAGGDEFIILLNDARRDEATNFAQEIMEEVRKPTEEGIGLTCSMGISVYPKDGDTLKRLLLAADRALYYVKRQEKNGFSFYGDGNEDSILALQRRQQFLSENVAGGMIGGYLEPGFPLYFIDESLLSWLGYESQEEFILDTDGLNANNAHPDDRMMIEREIKRQLAVSEYYAMDHRIRKKDGSYIWVHTVGKKSITADGREAITIACYDISAEKEYREQVDRLQEEMKRKNEQLSVILKAIPGGLKCSRDDETYSYVFVSEEVAGLFGYSLEEFMEAKLGSAVGAVYPPDLPRVLEGLSEDFAKGPDYAQKYRVQCKDGSLKWILDCGRRMKDTQGNYVFNSLYLDITKAEEAEQESLKQHELLTSIYNTVPCGILRLEYVNDHYEILSINSAAWRLTTGQENVKPEDFWKNGMAKTLLEEDRHLIEESYEDLKNAGDRNEVDYRVRWYDGSIHILHRSSFLILNEDDRRVLQCIFVDITESKALQDALEDARIASLAKTDFLSRMSHDIRTPLNAILNLNRLMAEELDKPEKLREDMEKIDVAGEFLLQLINDILDISRIESGHLELKPHVYTYATFLNYIRGIITPLCEDKDITFILEEGPTALDIYMDRARFHQVFFNLLSNAVKFTPPGGTVSFTTCNNVVHDGVLSCDFVVADTGCGMSEETIAHAFEPFARGNATDAYVGTGLGLAICKQILDKMGATIKIESEEGKGTVITVHMDLLIATEEQRRKSQTELDTSYHGNPAFLKVSDCRILIAEDNAINAEILQRLLEKNEIHTECVFNGREAVDAIISHDSDYYQMILMDVRMPVMDGMAATKEIRQMKDEIKRNIPIIAITANAFESDALECYSAGMNSCLAKPVSPHELYEMIATYIKLEG